MLIDAHQHFWSLSRRDYGWLTPAVGSLYSDFAPSDLRPVLRQAGVDGTVLVQAAPTVAETAYLLGIADAEPFIRAVVGWVDLEGPGAPAELAEFARHPNFRGIRPMLQDLAPADWILMPGLTPAIRAIVALDLSFDALIRPHQITAITELLGRHPDLRLIVDHGAKPDIAGREWQPWADDIARLAGTTHAACKLSGLLGEAEAGAERADLTRYVDHLLICFGPERLIWGSDYPLVVQKGGYQNWLEMSRLLVASAGPGALDAIFGGNAARFYRFEGSA